VTEDAKENPKIFSDEDIV